MYCDVIILSLGRGFSSARRGRVLMEMLFSLGKYVFKVWGGWFVSHTVKPFRPSNVGEFGSWDLLLPLSVAPMIELGMVSSPGSRTSLIPLSRTDCVLWEGARPQTHAATGPSA